MAQAVGKASHDDRCVVDLFSCHHSHDLGAENAASRITTDVWISNRHSLVRLDVGCFDHCSPLLGLLGNMFSEIGRCNGEG